MVVLLGLSVIVVETGIMVVLASLPPLEPWQGVVLDSLTLITLLSPMLYVLAFRPLVRTLHEREEAAEALRQANARLRDEVAARERHEAELALAESRYRTVADFTYDWEYWKGPDGRLLYCSPSCERVTGYAAAELTARPQLLDQLIQAEDRELWARHVCENRAPPDARSILFRLRRKDGEVRWIDHSCRVVTGARGEFLGIRASNRDVTERKLAEIEKEQLREELARAGRAATAGQLSASMVHELSQPLGAILLNLASLDQLLGRDAPPMREVREALRETREDTERARRVLDQLRGLFCRGVRNKAVLQLNQVIGKTVELLQSEFAIKGVDLRLNLDSRLPEILGNEAELQQVALNLAGNAVQAMAQCPPGSRCLLVSTSPEPAGAGGVRASFYDSGPGIPREVIESLAVPLYTVGGGQTGNSLALCRFILESHGGRLWAENQSSGGTAIHFTLPAISEPDGFGRRPA
jgi:PAS domain S-box-containing protein